jgi:electron transfer flavoprotein beta subunit
MMTIAICLKHVPARDWAPRVDATGRRVDETDAAWVLSEPDAYALEAALRLKDAWGGEVIAITAGPGRARAVLREALARGADRAILVEDDRLGGADPALAADALAGALRGEAVDLVFSGLQSDDQGQAQTGGLLGERLGLPVATIVVAIEPGAGEVRVKRELEAGWFQWVTLPLPALLTIQSGIDPLRYATLKGTMAARKKEVRVVPLAASAAPVLEVVALSPPRARAAARRIEAPPAEAARALVDALREAGTL